MCTIICVPLHSIKERQKGVKVIFGRCGICEQHALTNLTTVRSRTHFILTKGRPIMKDTREMTTVTICRSSVRRKRYTQFMSGTICEIKMDSHFKLSANITQLYRGVLA